MGFNNLHTSWITGSFENDIEFLIKVRENNALRLYGAGLPGGSSAGLQPYYDGSISIGYGFDLVNNPLGYVQHFLSLVGVTLTTAQTNIIKDAKINPLDTMNRPGFSGD